MDWKEKIMEKILIIVDMQKDFVDGSLGTKEAQAIVPAVKEKIENFDGDIIFTKDTHHMEKIIWIHKKGRIFQFLIVLKEHQGMRL